MNHQSIQIPSSVVVNGVWYEVEPTLCYTYAILRDKHGKETSLYYDIEDWLEFLNTNGVAE